MNEDDPSPEWHRQVLGERERLIASGEIVFIDWEQAKEELLQESGSTDSPHEPSA